MIIVIKSLSFHHSFQSSRGQIFLIRRYKIFLKLKWDLHFTSQGLRKWIQIFTLQMKQTRKKVDEK